MRPAYERDVAAKSLIYLILSIFFFPFLFPFFSHYRSLFWTNCRLPPRYSLWNLKIPANNEKRAPALSRDNFSPISGPLAATSFDATAKAKTANALVATIIKSSPVMNESRVSIVAVFAWSPPSFSFSFSLPRAIYLALTSSFSFPTVFFTVFLLVSRFRSSLAAVLASRQLQKVAQRRFTRLKNSFSLAALTHRRDTTYCTMFALVCIGGSVSSRQIHRHFCRIGARKGNPRCQVG